MTYAIIETGGKQLRVEPGRFYDVERLAVEVDERVLINQVLFVGSDDDISIGQPFVEGAVVEATVLRHLRGRKIIVYKMKPKKKTRKKRGHRQELTRLMINGISLNGDTIASVETTQVAAPVENIAVAATDDAATVADVAIAATDAVSEPLEDAPAVVEVEAPAEAEVSQAEVVVAETPIIEVAAFSAEAVDDEPVDAEASVVEVLADQDEASTATEESEVAIEDEAITDEAITDEAITDEAITGDDTDSAVEDETAEAEDDEMDEVADEA